MKRLVTLLLVSGLVVACDNASRDMVEERNQLIQKGLEQTQLKQWDQAIRYFEEALSENSELARPDLELALIFQQQKKNYIRAIYHYQRYMRKRPDSEKVPLIKEWIGQAEILFAAKVGQAKPTDSEISKEIIRLTRENNLLRQQLSRMAAAGIHSKPLPAEKPAPEPKPAQPKPAQPKAAGPEIAEPKSTPVSKKPIARRQTPAPIPETYKVLPGDTLSKIARTVYGDTSKWRIIYGANLDKMKSENDLRAGEIITIPKLEREEDEEPRG